MLNDNHWISSSYKQRMSVSDWKKILLNNNDQITYKGYVIKLKSSNLGYGIVEVYKDPKEIEKWITK